MKNVMYVLLFVVSSLLIACGDDDDVTPPDIVKETCEDGIKNQDEEEIDCGGVCTACITELLPFEAGNYRGLWSSTTSNGKEFLNLKTTARIIKIAEGEYTGSLFISNNYTSCCNSPGDNGDGPFTINIVDGNITFK